VRPKIPAGRTRRINGPAEWRALLKAANSRFRLVLRFAVRTAMRREEIAGLTWDRGNLQRRTVYLPRTQNGEQRLVPFSPRALAVLRQAGPKASRLVFGMSADAISAAMIDTRHRAGIEDLRFHDLRHEATSRLFEQTDLDVMEIKSITGHKSLQMLSRYSHLRTERLVERLAGARRGTPDTHGTNVIAFRESAR